MRTTVDIQNDLGARLRQCAAERGISFKEALNQVIAAGLDAWTEPLEPFTVKAKECGLRPGIDWNHLNRLADELDDEGRTL